MKSVIQKPFGSIYQSWKLAKLPEYVFFQEGPGLRKWQWTDDGIEGHQCEKYPLGWQY